MINVEEVDFYHHKHRRPAISAKSSYTSIRLPQGTKAWNRSGMTVPSAQSPSSHGAHWRGSDRSYHHEQRSTEQRIIPDVVERNVSRWRSERQGVSRNPVFKSDDESSQQDEVVNGTLSALQRDVEETTEILRRKNEQWKIERRQFQTEMEVTGRMSIVENDDWLATRLKAVSSDDMNRELGKIKDDQKQNAVTDTLAALVYDVNATAEVLRRGRDSMNRDKAKKNKKQEIEYHLRLTPQPDFPPPKREQPPLDPFTVDDMNRDYGVEMTESQTDTGRRKRARSETPRRTLQIEGSPEPEPAIICAYCSEEIEGAILTALAPNSERAQKFHTYHFMCTYCQKALTMHGTYR
ncbi:hypothetical protein WR25_21262 isoform A [Diploscapter pachys]|uniref:LIM zinc-binding domain-containing protein n=1 Tax=Diploscapter pachys TaxID=2018661 RepID=A0A2A2JD42_9BILA|nr:hypothetical protein WR25_21262 isoform A [Diploscapter pachys]